MTAVNIPFACWRRPWKLLLATLLAMAGLGVPFWFLYLTGTNQLLLRLLANERGMLPVFLVACLVIGAWIASISNFDAWRYGRAKVQKYRDQRERARRELLALPKHSKSDRQPPGPDPGD